MNKVNIRHVARLKTAARECYKTGSLHRLGELISEIGNLAELMRDDIELRGPVDPRDYDTVLTAILSSGDAVAQALLRTLPEPEQEKTA